MNVHHTFILFEIRTKNMNKKNSHYDFVCWFRFKVQMNDCQAGSGCVNAFPIIFHVSFFSLSLDLFVSMENVRYAVDVHATCGITHKHGGIRHSNTLELSLVSIFIPVILKSRVGRAKVAIHSTYK